ncbi:MULTISPECIES: TerD family protein [unclassified Streptomyces]|uniref:TerD family protein n=1 Tax=unclassified Streptomyces TaxID=2593676 RepID=UPI000DBA4B9D|nr:MULTISPECIES: TerD family protein [unclassified Streptomyces]MYT70987.1 export associated protein [Streptomyces sp. SID8367]RAJ75721.1 TerD domain-containing protein [Streptomyces sp. PsTaAH-137]
MAAELVRGQNHPLTQTRLEIRVSAGHPVVAGATLADDRGTVHGIGRVAHPGAPALPGLEVPRQAAADHRLAVDLDAMPQDVHRVTVLLALPVGTGGPTCFGAVAAPFVAVTGLDGAEQASYTVTDLDSESAVVALELYRRQDAWKVRAIGQGYADGLAALLADQGLSDARALAGTIHDAVAQGLARAVAPPPRAADESQVRAAATAGRASGALPPTPAAPAGGGPSGPIDYSHPRRQAPPPPPSVQPAEPGRPAAPVAGDASGWTMEERLYNQVWGMFEDLARTTAAYRSAVDFADSRMEQELDRILSGLSDPRSRIGSQGDAAREAARAKHGALVDRAREALDRDLAQLVAESEVVEPALPAPYAGWDNPCWHAYRSPMENPMAVRLGELRLPESDGAGLCIPMLVRLPLERGLWIDAGASTGDALTDADTLRARAAHTAVVHVARLLAVHPAGEFSVHVIDPAGTAAGALAPLVDAGVLAGPPARGAAGIAETLTRLTERVDLVQMAIRAGVADSLPPDLDTAEQLLVVHDFPHGFDDRAITRLRYLADEGPQVGVHLMLVADRADATEYGPLLDPLWRALLRLTPVPDDHLADPWVGHTWTYEPPTVPNGSAVLRQVLAEVAKARRDRGL